MKKRMNLEIYFSGGGYIKREITYQGKDLKEISNLIMQDENNLLEYMRTHDFKGEKSFCFCGFMFQKAAILAAQISEPELL